MWDLFGIGFAAGLALAIPVGPMAIMLINNTVSRGLKHGVVGAFGMATVDGFYAFAVFAVGSLISTWLDAYGLWLSLTGAAILLYLGVSTILSSLRILKSNQSNVATTSSGSVWNTYLKFMGATVVNPPTALYFLALAPYVSGFESEISLGTLLVFAVSVFVGSIIWQELLVVLGLGVRGLTTPKVRTIIGFIGGLMIVALAINMGVHALWS